MNWPDNTWYVDEYTRPKGLNLDQWSALIMEYTLDFKKSYKFKVTRTGKQKYELHTMPEYKMVGIFPSQNTTKIAIRMMGG